MSRRLVSLTLDTLTDLPHPCRDCVFWELDPGAAGEACATGDPALEKEAWISQTLLEWGSCGKLVYVDDTPAGYVMYAPPTYLPRSRSFPTSPPSPDAALLTTARVLPAYTGGGLGRMLVQGAARDLARRGLKAIEAFGDAREPNRDYSGDAREPDHTYAADALRRRPGAPDLLGQGADAGDPCVAPADFFVAVGFKTVRPHPRYPRLRLELRTALSWTSDVEYALARLFDTATAPTARLGSPATRMAAQASAPARLARSVETSIEPVATSDSTG